MFIAGKIVEPNGRQTMFDYQRVTIKNGDVTMPIWVNMGD